MGRRDRATGSRYRVPGDVFADLFDSLKEPLLCVGLLGSLGLVPDPPDSDECSAPSPNEIAVRVVGSMHVFTCRPLLKSISL